MSADLARDRLDRPQGEGLRIECGQLRCNTVTPFDDPMVLKLTAAGADRAQARAWLAPALDRVRIEGIRTDSAFVRALLPDPRDHGPQPDTRSPHRGAGLASALSGWHPGCV